MISGRCKHCWRVITTLNGHAVGCPSYKPPGVGEYLQGAPGIGTMPRDVRVREYGEGAPGVGTFGSGIGTMPSEMPREYYENEADQVTEKTEPKRIHNEGATGLVDHPVHYNTHPVCEAIDVVEHMSFNVGSAVKYLWRAGIKEKTPERQDLEKAAWYFRREAYRYGEIRDRNLEKEAQVPSLAPGVVMLMAAVAKHPSTSPLLASVLRILVSGAVDASSVARMNRVADAIEQALKGSS